MKAVCTKDETGAVHLTEKSRPTPGPNQCLIKMHAAALNRRDQWVRESLYPGIVAGVTLGSDGCGIVEEGPEEWVSKEVIINPSLNWGDSPLAQGPDYSILGLPVDGTLAEYLVADLSQIHLKPDHLSTVEAAAIPLAALTAYRACTTKGQITAGSRVLVTGAGGGVSQYALAIAKALGATVYVTSSSPTKIERSMELGASGGFNYRSDGWEKEALNNGGPFDVVIDGSGGDGLGLYLKLMAPGGRIVIYGATAGKPRDLDVRRLFWSQVSIHGSTMGSPEEFDRMLALFSEKEIRPVIDKVYSLDDCEAAFDRFKEKDHFGKIVLTID